MNVHVKPRLLIVEDDEGLQRQLRWAYDDYEVLVASDRNAAIDLLRSAEPAVVTLDLGLPPDPDGVSEGFAALEQAVTHLLHNALDASPASQAVMIDVLVDGAEVAISVIDSGKGMSADFIRNQLFQPFASTKEQGFGVGAYEAKSLLAAMGGRLEVESRLGDGTRFTLFLPGAESRAPYAIERKRA